MNAMKKQKHTERSGKYCHGKKGKFKKTFGHEEYCVLGGQKEMVLVKRICNSYSPFLAL